MMPSNGSQAKNGNANGHGSSPKPTKKQQQTSSKASLKPKAKNDSALASFKKLRLASKRPLPTQSGDGTYLTPVKRPGLREDIRRLRMQDVRTLLEIISHKIKGETIIDDKTMLMERTIQIVAGLSDHSKVQEVLTNNFIDQLWTSLDHPPMLYMGDAYRFRQPDGSNNNPYLPRLGAARTPYSRSVKPKNLQLGAQPDPEAVYEAVMARGEFRKNPNNVSSILWYWATIIIHDLFWTNTQDPNQNDSSSYLDLAPLYGCSKEACDSVRTFKDGMLKADSFADKRLIGNPPGVCILLIMFNRFHNHVAANLAEINEGGRFTKPSEDLAEDAAAAAAAWKKHDEELFQTARLVTSGLYINITLVDYVRNIVNLNRVDTTWTLDPRQEMGVSVGTKQTAEAGTGNVVSAEFNLCYRWHSCISDMDDRWIQDFYTQLLGPDHGPLTLPKMMQAVKNFDASVAKDPGDRVFGGLRRGPDGRFDDDELVDALATAIEQPGGAFGARNVPRVMKPVEMLGIVRGRRWNLAGLNEFRKHFGLKAYETFEDINSDPEVAASLRNLYQHPDNVELYPGIVAEEAKTPMAPGVGIAPTYTVSRVVLSDAVSLVRGDRHYTTDYNPRYLTNWGFGEAGYDLDVNHGCVFYKLFLRAFPAHFRPDSVYAHYPMVTPDENRTILTGLRRADRFDFGRPGFCAPRVAVTSLGGAAHVLARPDRYRASWASGLAHLMGETRSAEDNDPKADAEQRKAMDALLYRDDWKPRVKAFYSMMAERLLAEKSYALGGRPHVDVVRDVGNLAHTHFVARVFNLPLKTGENPRGVYSEQELYAALVDIFAAVFLDVDPAASFPLRQKAKAAAAQLGRVVETNVKLATTLGVGGLFTKQDKNDPLAVYGVNVAKGLKKAGMSASEITWGQILPTAGAMVPNQAQVFAQAVDWYLSPAGEPYRPELHRVALQESTEETDALLLGYAMEGLRMAGSFSLCRQAATADVIREDDGRKVSVQAGDKVFVSFASAAHDGAHFPHPDAVDPRRPADAYAHYGLGGGGGVGQVALTELFRALFRRSGLRRAAGLQGELKKVVRPGGFCGYMDEEWGRLTPFPTSMKVMWDGE